jgi:ParB-like chromosome segregation protein Spo0J
MTSWRYPAMVWRKNLRYFKEALVIMKQELKSSSKRIGQLYPILVDYFGNIIDGKHRFSVDEKWKSVRLEHIKTDKDRLVARIIGNNLRRTVSSNEKRELLGRLGEILLSEGIEPGKIAYKIAEETCMSYQWVMKYLPDRFKDCLQSERAKPALRRRAKKSKLLDPPEGVLSIRAYANTEFVNIVVKKPLYEKLEEKARKLETTPDKLIFNAILLILKT